jgi:acetyltransferase-like isoleucine patch superfamily enzyme
VDDKVDPVTGAARIELPDNVVVGRDCRLEWGDAFRRYRSTREPGLVIGDRVQIFTWTMFSLERDGQVTVGDDAVLVGALVMCASTVTIGRRVVVSYNVSIADSDFHPMDPELRRVDARACAPIAPIGERPPLVSAPVHIEDDAWLGIGCMVLKGTTIGAGARVAPGTVVSRDVPPGAHVEGNPMVVVAEP